MWQFLELSLLEMELRKKQKFQSGRKNSKNNLKKKEEQKNSQWSPSNQSLYLKMSKKIYIKDCWESKKEKENKDCKGSGLKASKICVEFHRTYFQNQKANLFTKLRLKHKNLLQSHYLGTVKLICFKEFKEKRKKEEKEYFKKLLINTMTLIYLKVFRKWLKEDKKVNRKSRE